MQRLEARKNLLNKIIEANVILTLFCLPFSKSIVEICVTLAIISFFAKKIFIDKRIDVKIDRKVLIAAFLFVIFNMISLINTPDISSSTRAMFSKVFKWVLLFVIVADTIRTPAQARRIFTAMMFSVVLILADAVYQHYITGYDFLHFPNPYPVFKIHARLQGGTSFPTASFPYPNDFAAWINIMMFAFLAPVIFDLHKKKLYKAVVIALIIGLAIFLFLTTSRSAILGTFVSLTILLFLNIKRLLLPLGVILIVAALIISINPYLRGYFVDSLSIRLSLDDRVGMWSTGWKVFKDHPVIGNGVNTFFIRFKELREDEDKGLRGSYAHNCYLQMAADIGIFGLLSFIAFVFLVLFSAMRRAARNLSSFQCSLALGLALGVIAFLVHSFFDTNLYSLNLAALFWLGLGLVEGMNSGEEA